jgi:hypothetical protein
MICFCIQLSSRYVFSYAYVMCFRIIYFILISTAHAPVRPGSFRPADLLAPGRFAPESESIRPEKWVDSPHLIAIIL